MQQGYLDASVQGSPNGMQVGREHPCGALQYSAPHHFCHRHLQRRTRRYSHEHTHGTTWSNPARALRAPWIFPTGYSVPDSTQGLSVRPSDRSLRASRRC
eukprot:scaffold156587_cov33-Tisochrysis_lutea.AAC.2